MIELDDPHVKVELEAGCAVMILKEYGLVVGF
jgi:hypothetical protein